MKHLFALFIALFSLTVKAQFISHQGQVLNLNYNLLNESPKPFSLTFKNTGSSVASLPSATGSGVGVFKVALNRCVNVAPNKSCQISYAPPRNIALGTYVFMLSGMEINYQVVRQDANGPVIIPDVENLEVSPSSLDPIQFSLGDKRKVINLSIKNTGNTPISPSFGWSNNNANIKFIINRCINLINPNRSCSLSISIPSPDSNQEFTQDLQVYSGFL